LHDPFLLTTGKDYRCSVDATLDGLQGLSGRCEEGKHLWTFLAIKTLIHRSSNPQYWRRTDWVIPAAFQYQLQSSCTFIPRHQ